MQFEDVVRVIRHETHGEMLQIEVNMFKTYKFSN